MTNPLDGERSQFFLRHRDDIREWASIERDVIAATKEILEQIQPVLEERLRTMDPNVEVIRRDGGRYSRILARHPDWPDAVGMTLEWEPNVDPFGSSLPKFGIFFLNSDQALVAAHQTIAQRVRESAFMRSSGYKVGDGIWPAVRWVPKSATWWQDPDAWAGGIVDTPIELWPDSSSIVDEGLARV